MLKATQDFQHQGISIKAGAEVPATTFEPDDYPGLMAKGLLVDDSVPAKAAPAVKARTPRKEKTK